ncbi:MAG: hypothetical protein SGJ11_02010 [Phycisphaerae bacterium]|nr:hypothetical protein [Phycisphaerae bacterium]
MDAHDSPDRNLPSSIDPLDHTPTYGTPQPSPGMESVNSHDDVLALIDDVERQLARLRGVQSKSAEDFAHFADRSRRLDVREHEVQSAAATLIARQAQLQAMTDALEDERAELRARATALAQQSGEQADTSAMLETTRQELVAERARVNESAQRLIAEEEVLQALRHEVETNQSARDADVETLTTRLAGSEAQTAALVLELARVRESCEDAEASLASRDAVVELRDREIIERDTQKNTLQRELDMTRQSLRTAGEKLAALAKSVADQAPQLERGAAALAAATEMQRTIEKHSAETAEIRRANERLTEELAAARQAMHDRSEAHDETTREALLAAREEAARLTSEMDALRAAHAATQRDATTTLERRMCEIEAAELRMHEALVFLRTRKTRIDLARRLLRERKWEREARVRESTESALVGVLEEERLVKKQREELRQVQEMLAVTEERMMRRYARHRGGIVAAWMMLVTAAIAAGAWLAADFALPSTAIASVDLVAKTRGGEQISPQSDSAWQAMHASIISDETFRTAVRRRLEERGVHSLRGETVLAEWMDGVHVDSDGPGSMRLIAEAPTAEVAVIALDTLATTLVNEAPKFAKGKGDMARIALAGQTQVPGRMTFSTIVPQEGRFDRLMAAGLLFSGIVTLGLIVGGVVSGRIARAKRRFEDAERFGTTL